MTKCIQDYVVSKTGCAIDWFKPQPYPACVTKEDYSNVRERWNWLFDATYDAIVAETGCLRKCNYMKYEIVKEQTVPITWNTTEWLSEFYVFTESENIMIRCDSHADYNALNHNNIFMFLEVNIILMTLEI